MSLAISVILDDYIMASSDSAVTFVPVDADKFYATGESNINGEMEKTDFKSQKVIPLTDRVYLITVGQHVYTEAIKQEMAHHTKAQYDLVKCAEVAKNVMTNLQKGKTDTMDHLVDEINKFRPEEPRQDVLRGIKYKLAHLFKSHKASAYLVGFDEGGKAGCFDMISGERMTPSGNNYPLLVLGEDPGYSADPNELSKYQKALIPPIEQRNIETFINRFSWVHADIAFNSRVNVSPDCNLHVMQKDGDKIKHGGLVIQTDGLWERMGLTN